MIMPKNPKVTAFIGNVIIFKIGLRIIFTRLRTIAPVKIVCAFGSIENPSIRYEAARSADAFEITVRIAPLIDITDSFYIIVGG